MWENKEGWAWHFSAPRISSWWYIAIWCRLKQKQRKAEKEEWSQTCLHRTPDKKSGFAAASWCCCGHHNLIPILSTRIYHEKQNLICAIQIRQKQFVVVLLKLRSLLVALIYSGIDFVVTCFQENTIFLVLL